MPRLLTVCADDFGLTRAVCDGVMELVRARRVTAVSCMTNAPYWEHGATALQQLPASACAGLHINLTEGYPLSRELARQWPRLPGLPALLALTHLGRTPQSALQAEIEAQWTRFVLDAGEPPRFVDGHQHVHQFPGVRDALFAALDRLGARPAIRSTATLIGPGHGLKRWIVRHTGARQLQASLQQRGLPHNAALLGAYDFDSRRYRHRMRAWLAAVPDSGGLLYCHPGHAPAADATDAIGRARQHEFDYLASDDFTHDLTAADVVLQACRAQEGVRGSHAKRPGPVECKGEQHDDGSGQHLRQHVEQAGTHRQRHHRHAQQRPGQGRRLKAQP